MYRDFNAEYPKMRPLQHEVYGKLIFLGGAENDTLRSYAYKAGIRNILVSYFYLRNHNPTKVKQQLAKFDHVLLDAGGQAYIQQAKKGKPATVAEIQAYTAEYLEYVQEMAEVFTWVFEVDLASQLSEQFRKDHLDELRDNGIRVVPVVRRAHLGALKEHGFYKFPVVALHPELTESVSPELQGLQRSFADKGILMHAHGAVDEGSINRSPYFSVDSASWLAGGKYGVTYIWDNHRLQAFNSDHKEEIRNKYRHKFIAAGLDVEGIFKDDSAAVHTMNAHAWKCYADYAALHIVQSYWLTAAEQAKAKDLMIETFGLGVTPDAEAQYTQVARSAEMIRNTPIQTMLPEGLSPYIDPRMLMPRQCNTCQLRPLGDAPSACEAYKPDAGCYYANMVSIGSMNDMKGVLGALSSLQANRIHHGAMIEARTGGSFDPALSKELGTFIKMANAFGQLEKVERTMPKVGAKTVLPTQATQDKVKDLFEDDDDGEIYPTTPLSERDTDDPGAAGEPDPFDPSRFS